LLPSSINDVPLGAGDVLPEISVEAWDEMRPYLIPNADARRAEKKSREGTVHDE
jgi:hypothetical protein